MESKKITYILSRKEGTAKHMKSSGVTYYIVCIVAGALLLFAGCGRKSVKKVEPLRIVFFGDSVTYGYGVDDKTESGYSISSA